MTPVCMFRSMLRNKLFSEKQTSRDCSPWRGKCTEDTSKPPFNKDYEKDGDRFFIRTCSDRTRDNALN